MSNTNTEVQQEPIPTTPNLVDLVKSELESTTQANFARGCGVSSATLNQWMQGKYKGNAENVEKKVLRYFEDKARKQHERRAIAGEPEFFETSVSELVFSTLDWTQWMGDIGLIYGGAGLGKTRAVRRFVQQKNNAWIVECDPTNAQGMAMLRSTLKSVRHNVRPGRQSECFAELCDITRGTKGILIFDDAQFLTQSSLEMLRRLNDLSGVGIALVGNEDVYVHVTGGSRRADFAQIFSRVGNKLNLSKVARDDIEVMVSAWTDAGCLDGATLGEDAMNLLTRVGQSNGGMRNVQKLLNRSIILAAGEDKPMGLKHLKQAWRALGGTL